MIPRNSGSRELLRLCIGVVLGFAAFNMCAPLVPLLLLDLRASPGLLGVVISVSTLGSLFVGVPGGLLVNSWGSRRLMQRSGYLVAAACVFLALFPSIAGLFVGLAFLEIGKILFILGAQAHVSTLGEGRDLNLDFGWYGTAAAVGQMLGPAMAGIWIDTSGHRATWVFVALLISGTAVLLPRLVSPGMVSVPAVPGETPKTRKNLRHYLSVYALIAILSSFAVIFADGARTTFYPVLLRDFGYSATVIGLYMSLRAFVSVSVRFFMGGFIRLAGGKFPALIVSLFILALGIGMTPFCMGPFLLGLNAIFVGIGIGMALPLSMATVSEGVSPEDRGIAMGIRLTGNRLAQLINPMFFGGIAQGFGLGAAFVSGGFLLFGSTLPVLAWWRGEKRRSAEA